MPDGVAALVRDRHAPRGLGVARGRVGQVAGQSRVAQISTELADATQIDLLPELRAPGADPARVWKELSLPRQREIVRLLCEVTLLPGRMRQPFDPQLQMRIEWRQ